MMNQPVPIGRVRGARAKAKLKQVRKYRNNKAGPSIVIRVVVAVTFALLNIESMLQTKN